MNNNKIFWINIFMTLLFLGFNIIVTYNADLDDFFWLIPGLTISGITNCTKLKYCAHLQEPG